MTNQQGQFEQLPSLTTFGDELAFTDGVCVCQDRLTLQKIGTHYQRI